MIKPNQEHYCRKADSMSAMLWKGGRSANDHEGQALAKVLELLTHEGLLDDNTHVLMSFKFLAKYKLIKKVSEPDSRPHAREVDMLIVRPGEILHLELKQVQGTVVGADDNNPWRIVEKNGTTNAAEVSGGGGAVNPYRQVSKTRMYLAGFLQEKYRLWKDKNIKDKETNADRVVSGHACGLNIIRSFIVAYRIPFDGDTQTDDTKDQVTIEKNPWLRFCRIHNLPNELRLIRDINMRPGSDGSKFTDQVIRRMIVDLDLTQAKIYSGCVIDSNQRAKDVLALGKITGTPHYAVPSVGKVRTTVAENQEKDSAQKKSCEESKGTPTIGVSRPQLNKRIVEQQQPESKAKSSVITHNSPSADKGSLPSVVQKQTEKQNEDKKESKHKSATENQDTKAQTDARKIPDSESVFSRRVLKNYPVTQVDVSPACLKLLDAFIRCQFKGWVSIDKVEGRFEEVNEMTVLDFIGYDLDTLSRDVKGEKYFWWQRTDDVPSSLQIASKNGILKKPSKVTIERVGRYLKDEVPESVNFEQVGRVLGLRTETVYAACVLSLNYK